MQTGFFTPKNKPLKVMQNVQVLLIVPAEMIATYVCDNTGFGIEAAALIAMASDESAAEALANDMK